MIKKFKFNIKIKILVTVFVILLLSLGIYFVYKNQIQQNNKTNIPLITTDNFTVSCPENWNKKKITSKENSSGILFQCENPKTKSLFVLKAITGKPEPNLDINLLQSSIIKSLKKNIQGFKTVEKEVTTFGEFNSVHIVYTQQIPSLEVKDKNILVIVPTEKQTFYLLFKNQKAYYTEMEGDIRKISEEIIVFLNDTLNKNND